MEVDQLRTLLLYVRDDLSDQQIDQLFSLGKLYRDWNSKVNLISRRDIDFLFERHVLHSLMLDRVLPQQEHLHAVDIGTGGGFPGIPLAVVRPNQHFHLIDATRKKINVVENVCQSLQLKNVTAYHQRVEDWWHPVQLVMARAVAQTSQLLEWTKQLYDDFSSLEYYLLKGGDLSAELNAIHGWKIELHPLSTWVDLPFYATKQIVHLYRDSK